MQTTTIDHQALRQRFNPDGSQLRKHQLRMLEILVVIDKICRKHQIPYWLSSGTLIGAVRHNGFIPWDDDLDIEMMRNDYLHLLEVLTKELPDWLALQTDETDPNYFFFYAKVRDRRSVLNEGNNYDRMWKEKGIERREQLRPDVEGERYIYRYLPYGRASHLAAQTDGAFCRTHVQGMAKEQG